MEKKNANYHQVHMIQAFRYHLEETRYHDDEEVDLSGALLSRTQKYVYIYIYANPSP